MPIIQTLATIVGTDLAAEQAIAAGLALASGPIGWISAALGAAAAVAGGVGSLIASQAALKPPPIPDVTVGSFSGSTEAEGLAQARRAIDAFEAALPANLQGLYKYSVTVIPSGAGAGTPWTDPGSIESALFTMSLGYPDPRIPVPTMSLEDAIALYGSGDYVPPVLTLTSPEPYQIEQKARADQRSLGEAAVGVAALAALGG